ncbi:Mak10-domain-containing protein [Xylariaceae sp. FL0255]|nr:Mak10-domain-containing protein [Xylariaceae sp. FL0255]
MQSTFDIPPPPPPNISHPGIMAIDITEQFAAAVKTLKPGDLVKDEHFTLFESVSALEIMDKKMDSGVLEEGESLDEEYDVGRELLPEEIVGIIDQLLCLEMAWHLGYPLSQTLFTSVYVEALLNPRPGNLDDANFTRNSLRHPRENSLMFVLRAYCVGLLKGCCLVNDLVKDELYYEEEDFVTNTYDRDLLYDIPAEDVSDLLLQAWQDLRALKTGLSEEICKALERRLNLRILFLDAVNIAETRISGGSEPAWTGMEDLIKRIESQHGLGKPVPEAFSTKLQRRLASTMPPRPMVKLSFEECVEHFKRLCQNGAEVTDVLEYKDPQSLLNFVMAFQSQKPQPLVFIRTILQNLLFKDMVVLGQFSIRQIIDHDVSICVLPAGPHIDRDFDEVEVPTDPRHQIAAQMEIFRQRVADVYLDTFRILCQNRCRVRRTLYHHIQEWDALEVDIGEIEDRLREPLQDPSLVEKPLPEMTNLPLTSWAYLYKLRQMEWIVQFGFELSVYAPDELAWMYYYLKVLASLRAQHTEHIKRVASLREEQAHEAAFKSKKPLDPGIAHEYNRSKQHLRASMLDAACTWEFADGLSLLYTVLLRLGLIKPRRRPYSTDRMRFDLRMKPFSRVAYPSLPTYDEYLDSIPNNTTPTLQLIKIAETAISAARRGLEASAKMSRSEAFAINETAHKRWIARTKDCLRATIAAGVAVTTVKRACERAGGGGLRSAEELEALRLKLKVEIPEPGDGYHEWWIVPKITPLR